MENNTNKPPKPDNYLVWAILSTVLCCLPTGIASIVYATKVDSAYNAGNYEEATKASKNAKMWALIGLFAGIVVMILAFGLGFLGAVMDGGF
jgi:uncharacterized membrane protein